MGHKGDISGVYQFSGLTEDDEDSYRQTYKKYVESEIDEKIFGIVSNEEKTAAMLLEKQAIALGVAPEKLEAIRKILEIGQMNFEQFSRGVTSAIEAAQNAKLESMVEAIMKKRLFNGKAPIQTA